MELIVWSDFQDDSREMTLYFRQGQLTSSNSWVEYHDGIASGWLKDDVMIEIPVKNDGLFELAQFFRLTANCSAAEVLTACGTHHLNQTGTLTVNVTAASHGRHILVITIV